MIKRPLCLAAAVLAVCILTADWLGFSWIWRSPAGPQPETWAKQEQQIEAVGTVYKQEEKEFDGNTQIYLYLKQTNLIYKSKLYPIRNIKCYCKQKIDDISGRTVRLEGVLTLPEAPGNPGEFDEVHYERSRKIDFVLKKCRVLKTGENKSRLEDYFRKIREKCCKILESIYPVREAGLLEAMLLGEKKLVDTEAKDWLRFANLSHIIAISGLHAGILGMGVWALLKRTGLSPGLSGGVSVMILTLYGVVIGNPTTALRAIIMFVVLAGSRMLGRSYDLLSSLALAGILLLADNPDLLWDSGFQLSFMAVAGTGSFFEKERRIWKGLHKEQQGKKKECSRLGGRMRKLAEQLTGGFALWLFMLPVVLKSFSQVSLWGILCNLLVIPLLPVVLGSGGLAAVLGAWDIGAGSWAGYAAHQILQLYLWMGRTASLLPLGIWTPGQPSSKETVCYYSLLLLNIWMAKWVRTLKNFWRLQGITAAALLLLMSGLFRVHPQAAVLDVGQGDGIIFQTKGGNGLIDGGSTSRSKVGSRVILPYMKSQGISRLHGIFLTHSDQDHVNGAKEVLEEARLGWLSVDYLFMPVWMKETKTGKNLEKAAAGAGTVCRYVKAGDQIRMGQVQIDILYPQEGDFREDPNGGSLVFRWEWKSMSGLFTGDLPEEKEKGLAPVCRKCSFLKVGHHGSNGSSGQVLLKALRPEAALISCGKKNRYGHPGKEAVSRLEESGARVFRTDVQGALLIWKAHGGFRVEGYRDGKGEIFLAQ